MPDRQDSGPSPTRELDPRTQARLPDLAELARSLLGADATLISLAAEGGERVVAAVGVSPVDALLPADACLEPVLVVDTVDDPEPCRHALAVEHGFRFYLAVALRPDAGGPTLGTLRILAREPRPEGVEAAVLEQVRLLGQATAALLEASLSLQRCEADRINDRAMVDAMTRCTGVGFALTDSSDRFVDVNDTLANMLGTSPEALRGREADSVVAQHSGAARPSPLQDVFQSGDPSAGYWFTRTPRGKYRTLRNYTERLQLRNGPCSLSVLHDVTADRTQEAVYSLTAAVLEMVVSERPAGAILRRIGSGARDYRPDAAVLVMQRQDNRLRRKYGTGLPPGLEPHVRTFPLASDGPAAQAIAHTEPVIVADLAAEARWPEHRRVLLEHGLHAIWVFPFLGEDGEARGVLGLLLPRPEAPDSAEVSFLADVATLAGLALSREHLLRALREQVVSDPLTGLGNRTLLEDRMERQLAMAQREDSVAAVMLLDLDNFKVVNDTFGHDVGDDLLVTVGERLSDTLRTTDTLARLGGDEFVVLLPGCDWSGAERVAAGIVQALAEPIATESGTLRISPSIGITLMTHGDSDVDTVLKRADDAMYAAKAAGRNTFRRASAPADSDGY